MLVVNSFLIMADTLGILATSDKHLEYILSLTKAAHQKGKEVKIFFTGNAVRLTQVPEYAQLVDKACLSICETSFRSRGLKGKVMGVDFKDFTTQVRNAELMVNCDRYVVF